MVWYGIIWYGVFRRGIMFELRLVLNLVPRRRGVG